MNVEICNTLQVVKYLFKYIHKGPDRTSVAIVKYNHRNQNSNPQQFENPQLNPPQEFSSPQTPSRIRSRDEVTAYTNSRYVGREVFWRIFGYQMHEHKPAV